MKSGLGWLLQRVSTISCGSNNSRASSNCFHRQAAAIPSYNFVASSAGATPTTPTSSVRRRQSSLSRKMVAREPCTDAPSLASTVSISSHSSASLSPASLLLDDKALVGSSAKPYSTSAPAAQGMKDEYGTMDDSGETFVFDGDFVLENGQVLPQAQLRYRTYGKLNEARDNAVVICHALTGNASLHSWWGGLLGPGKAFDTDKYFVVCCNILGSCYGSSGPMSENPLTDDIYGIDFPDISVKDTVRLQLLMLKQGLQIRSVKCVIGGSFGGMQVMEYAVQGGSLKFGDFARDDADGGGPFVRSVIPIACGSYHTAWQIAISEAQRQAIYKDPQWATDPVHATDGLNVARQIAMISYRTHQGYSNKFGRRKQTAKKGEEAMVQTPSPEYGSSARWQAKSYLEYQGQKFLKRFDPISYVKMTEQMDSHDIARGRAESDDEVLSSIEIPALIMGIDSDVLYPLQEQQHLATHMPNSKLEIIHSDEGHDGFLLEQDQVGGLITAFLTSMDENSYTSKNTN